MSHYPKTKLGFASRKQNMLKIDYVVMHATSLNCCNIPKQAWWWKKKQGVWVEIQTLFCVILSGLNQ